ncbi:MAG: thymidylate synthase [archaeon]|nr:thymidylate synthase [archaeon]
MKLDFIEAFDLPDAWFKCIDKVMEHGYEYVVERGSFIGKRRKELDYVVIHIKNPWIRPIIPEIPRDLEGKVPPPTSMDYVHRYMSYIFTAIKKPNEEYTYGERMADQIDKVIEMCKGTPNTNQMCMEIGMPTDINLNDPPCMRLIDVRIRYGKLHFMPYFRSWDLWSGFPANLGALQLLKEYMAKEIGVKDGEIIASSKGLHLYEYQWGFAELLLRRRY